MNNVKTNNYKNALVEVEAVLDCLRDEDYCKIPLEVINEIEENKSDEYIYEYDEELDYTDWDLMPETKAILYNIFKKYLATPEQLQWFKEKERLEIMQSEKEKSEKYNSADLFKESKASKKVVPNENMQIQVINEKDKSFWSKLKRVIAKVFKK